MDDLTRKAKTDPTELYAHRDSAYAPEFVAVGVVVLDFFSLLSKSPLDETAICSSLSLAERPADVMLTLFCAMGYLEKKSGVFPLTEVAREFLVRSSPWFIGPYYAHMADCPIYRSLLETLRTNKPGGWAGAKSRKPWAEEMKDDAFAEQFTGTMDARGLYVGTVLAERLNLQGRRRVLDVAGGSGIYACCIAAAHPHVRATVFERSPVDLALRVAAFSVFIMSGTEGRAYSITEVEECLLAAGFVTVDYHGVILDYSIITARKP